jgi:hypothetical protein
MPHVAIATTRGTEEGQLLYQTLMQYRFQVRARHQDMSKELMVVTGTPIPAVVSLPMVEVVEAPPYGLDVVVAVLGASMVAGACVDPNKLND